MTMTPWTDRNCEVWVYETPCACDSATALQEERPAYVLCRECGTSYPGDRCQLVANQDIHYETRKTRD